MTKTHQKTAFVKASIVCAERIIEVLKQLQNQSKNVVPSSFYIYDLVEQRTLGSSGSVAAMLGYSGDAIQSMGPFGLASLIHPDDLEPIASHYLRCTTLVYGEVITTEYRMKHVDGTWCWLRLQETLLLEANNGLPLQILGSVRPMTPLVNSSPEEFLKCALQVADSN